MVVLVCGGRNYSDKERVFNVLDKIHSETAINRIVHGDAKGADSLGGLWAKERQIEESKFPANWKKYGKAAGFIRNQQMLDDNQIDLVVSFPGGNGTEDMKRRSRLKEIEVREIK